MPHNVRITLQNSDSEEFWCILSKDEDEHSQFEQVFSIRKGYGFSLSCSESEVKLIDYFAGETRAAFKILNKEETSEAVSLLLHKIKK